jgi:hypothetical protein
LIRHFGFHFFLPQSLPYWSGARLVWIGIHDSFRGRSAYPLWRLPCASFLPIGGTPARYAGVLDIQVDRSIPPQVMLRHTIKTAAWIIAFACGIWLLGFLVSIPLFVFSYLVYEAQARKLVGLVIAGLTFLFVWGMFDQLMHLAWPEAVLFTLLGF